MARRDLWHARSEPSWKVRLTERSHDAVKQATARRCALVDAKWGPWFGAGLIHTARALRKHGETDSRARCGSVSKR